MTTEEPETWIGNMQKAAEGRCNATKAACRCDNSAGHADPHRCAVLACANTWSDRPPYCNGCGNAHETGGVCLRGER